MKSAGIFIVEDSIIVSFHLQKMLESEGYNVIGTADSGEEAIQKIAFLKPELVLMDIMLNGELDGIQTATKLKQDFGIHVVYITALTDKETIQRAKITEPYGFLTKPIEDRELFTVVEMAQYKIGIEKKLKESEKKFLSTIRSISEGVLTMDSSFTVTYANPSAEKLLGLTLSDIYGKNIFEVFKLKNTFTGEQAFNPLQSDLENTTSGWPSHLILQSHDGKEIPLLERSINPIVNAKDHPIGLVITFKDGHDKLEKQKLKEEIKLQRLSAQIEGQEKERTRIARDLHDGLGQMLNAIKLNINTVIGEADKREELFALMDEAITETKRISENLLPSKIRDFDLATCLNSLCMQLQENSESDISFSAYTNELKLSELAKINLYRIAQEALSNAIKYSEASHISIQLIEDENHIRLMIEDDGKGIDFNNQRNGHGLVNMTDRALILHGICTIESDKNRGTIVIVEIPK